MATQRCNRVPTVRSIPMPTVNGGDGDLDEVMPAAILEGSETHRLTDSQKTIRLKIPQSTAVTIGRTTDKDEQAGPGVRNTGALYRTLLHGRLLFYECCININSRRSRRVLRQG